MRGVTLVQAVLTFVVISAVIVATIGANVLPYYEDYVKTLDLYHNYDTAVYDALVINPGIEIKFLVTEVPNNDNGIYFEPSSNPHAQNGNDGSGSALGILYLSVVPNYCDLISFGVNYASLNKDDDAMFVTLKFKSALDTPFLLEIPVFKLPKEYQGELTGERKKDFDSWREASEVIVTDSPFNKLDSDKIGKGEPIHLNLEWLSDVLSYPVTDSYKSVTEEGSTQVDSYIARPIVVSTSEIEKMYEIIDNFNKAHPADTA